MAYQTTRAFSYGGRYYKSGEVIDVKRRRDLRLFLTLGWVIYYERVPEPVPPPPEPVKTTTRAVVSEKTTDEKPKTKRTYKRRDMTSED